MGTSKKPYFVSGLIFFLATALSKFSRNQVRTAGAKLRGTHRHYQVRTAGAKLRGTRRHYQVRTAGAKLRGTRRQPLKLAPLLPPCIKKEFNQVRTAGAKLRGTHRHCAKFQKRFFRGCLMKKVITMIFNWHEFSTLRLQVQCEQSSTSFRSLGILYRSSGSW